MTHKRGFLKIITVIIVFILITAFYFFGYRLSYKKDIEKIDSSTIK